MRPSSALWWQCADSHHTPDRLGGTTAAYYSSDNGYCTQWYTGNQDSNGELTLEERIMGAAIVHGEARSIDPKATKQDMERIEQAPSSRGS